MNHLIKGVQAALTWLGSLILVEPGWEDLCLLIPLLLGIKMRFAYTYSDPLAEQISRWAVSALLALYGATLVLSGLTLLARGARTLARHRGRA